MKVEVDSAEMLRYINRHMAKALADLEEINCPIAYRDVVRNRFGFLRSDLVALCRSSRG